MMNIYRKQDIKEWKSAVFTLIERMQAHFGCHKKVCAGIDVRRSGPFISQELMGCKSIAFFGATLETCDAFAILNFKVNCVYIALLCALKKGMGHLLVRNLQISAEFDQPYLVVRSTDSALSFYLKSEFVFFDWRMMEEVIMGGDVQLSRSVDADMTSATREQLRSLLRARDWVSDEMTEWPLLLHRGRKIALDLRRSKRLQEKTGINVAYLQ